MAAFPSGSESRRRALDRRLLNLGTGELVAAAVFAGVAVVAVMPRLGDRGDVVALWAALLPLLVILVQAGVYWLLSRGWAGRGRMPARVAAVYRAFRVLDPVLLLAGLAVAVAFAPPTPGLRVLLAAAWLFGVIEYVNYFVVRLSYPVGRWFSEVGKRRAPRIVRDLRVAG